MTSAKLIAVTLALTLLPKACGKKDEAADAAPVTVETAAVPSTTDTATTPSALTSATPVKPVTKVAAKDAGGDAAAAAVDAGPADAGAVASDAGNAKKGFLPPRVDVTSSGAHIDQGTVASRVHVRDASLSQCYTLTGKDPGSWDKRCYDLVYRVDGTVTAAEGKSLDALGVCTKIALTGVQLGEPKDKQAGRVNVCLATR